MQHSVVLPVSFSGSSCVLAICPTGPSFQLYMMLLHDHFVANAVAFLSSIPISAHGQDAYWADI